MQVRPVELVERVAGLVGIQAVRHRRDLALPPVQPSSVRSALAFAVAWRPDLVRDQGLTQGLSPAHSATWDGLRRLEG